MEPQIPAARTAADLMALSKEISELIRKYAIKNAMDFGKARTSNVLGKIISSVPKDKLPELKFEVDKVVNEVNNLPRAELEREYEPFRKGFDEQHEKIAEATSKPRMVLDGATKGDFATRFPPEPSGYLHIGHAKSVFLAQEFSRIYDGKLFLYFDDTNPEKESQEYVDQCKSDLNWLGVKFDKEYYASDALDIQYKYARKLIDLGKAYACECDAEEMKRNRFEGKECAHRNRSPEANAGKFADMLENKYGEGKIVIRFKGDMKSNNTAMRDPTLLRVKKDRHYRQGNKYVVWPTYDLNTPINDSLNGVTDVIRDKNYELRDELHFEILKLLDLRVPRIHSEARLSIKGQPKQKREIRKLISEGRIKSYDDPRLVTIVALKRRGVQPGAIRNFVLSSGMSKMNSEVDLTYLFAENKKIIDPVSKRLYYVPAPVDVEIINFGGMDVTLDLHPSGTMGSRKYTAQNKFYISGTDAAELKVDHLIILKGLFCLQMKRSDDSWIGEPVKPESENGIKRIQWVCDGNYLKCEVLMPEEPLDREGNFRNGSLRTNSGYVETYATSLEKGDIVQFERFGFCILDDKENMQFIFISK